MFFAMGIILACYIAYAALQGAIVVKSGVQARTVLKAEAPAYYWTCISIYALLSIALMTIF